MKNIFKTVCVLLLSIALLFTMTPINAIAEDLPAAKDQKQEQNKEESKKQAEEKKSEPEKKETTKETEKPADPEKDKENKDSENAGQEAKENTGSKTETNADKGDDTAKEETEKEDIKKEEATQKDETKPSTTEETKKEEDKYPAQTLTANAGGVKVTLKAPKGSLPEGSKLKAKQVGQKYINAVENKLEAQGRELTDAVAIDVTPVSRSGKEIQPKKSVMGLWR